ncbi:MAG: dTMP kinase [Pseudomonadota bacterium]|nr:dTMP kinase [Pseudomonadota bacterium]
MAGKFITIEGGEGAGKSTQAQLLGERLRAKGHKVLLTREPGGSDRAEKIRDFLLSGSAKGYGAAGEAVLFASARDDHLEKTIRPALEKGEWVVCDRFMDSTRAYQGAAGGARTQLLAALERLVVGPDRPDLTLVLDRPADAGLKRARARKTEGADEAPDRFEAMDEGFHDMLRRGFLDIARSEPERCVIIDAGQNPASVAEDVWEAVMQRLEP